MSHTPVKALPEYDGNMPVDYEHEEQVRGVYRPMLSQKNAAVEASAPVDYDRDTYNFDRDPDLYNLDDRNHQKLRLKDVTLQATHQRLLEQYSN